MVNYRAPRPTARWLGFTSLMGALMVASLLIFVASRAPHYSLTSSTVSELAGDYSPHATTTRLAVVVYGLLLLPTALAAYRLQEQTMLTIGVAGLLAGAAAAIVVTGLVSTTSQQQTLVGLPAVTLHGIAARLGTLTVMAAMASECYLIRGKASWRGFYFFSLGNLAAVIIGGSVFALDPWPSAIGAFEWVLLSASITWLTAFALKLSGPALQTSSASDAEKRSG